MEKEITTNDLALMIGKGFTEVDKRFSEMDKRFDKIENILLKQQGEEIADLKKRMSRLEDALAIK